jgi:hypothetical protein
VDAIGVVLFIRSLATQWRADADGPVITITLSSGRFSPSRNSELCVLIIKPLR